MDIVIVDDEAVSLTVIKQIVGRVPECHAQGFTQPAAALPWCQANDPDLLIVGYVMPEFNGIEFTRQVRALHGKSETPVLMVTASTDPRVREEALRSGINDFLTKPFDSAELQQRVQNMLLMRSNQKTSLPQQPSVTTDARRQPALPIAEVLQQASKRLLDVNMTMTRLAGDHQLFSEIARVFLRTAPQLLADTHHALSKNDMERASAEAHSLKGAVAAFEAPEVYSAVALLQTHAANYDAAAAKSAFVLADCLATELMGELGSIARQGQPA